MQPTEIIFMTVPLKTTHKKKGWILLLCRGVIDGDYYGNQEAKGHIFAQMKNSTDQEVVLEVGERIVPGCLCSLS